MAHRAATGPDASAVNRRLELDLGPDGALRPYEVRLATLREERGDGVLAVASARDLTAERELARLKNEFVSQASHELRTPLASLRAYLEMISDGEAASDEERAEFLRIATEETERLSRLLDNMLNISRIESGLRHIDRTAVDLKATARRAIEALEGQAREKSIMLSVRTADVDCTVDGDADLLLEVVQNLVSNAIKYTPEGGRVTVGVDTDPLTRSVVASVTDTVAKKTANSARPVRNIAKNFTGAASWIPVKTKSAAKADNGMRFKSEAATSTMTIRNRPCMKFDHLVRAP